MCCQWYDSHTDGCAFQMFRDIEIRKFALVMATRESWDFFFLQEREIDTYDLLILILFCKQLCVKYQGGSIFVFPLIINSVCYYYYYFLKIHTACLNNWRLNSVKDESYFSCDQCKYRFN